MAMRYQWVDYCEGYREAVDALFDSEAVKYTGCEEGWEPYFEYWKQEPETVLNGNFFVKVILYEGKTIGIMAVFLDAETYYIQEFVIRPDSRSMGIGGSILRELIENGGEIFHGGQTVEKTLKKAEAAIFPSNAASIRAFEKAGFRYSHSHPEGDVCYYRYRKES